MAGEDDQQLSDAQLAELAGFADGSLPPDRQAEVAAAVERSPQLRALVDEQRAALAAVEALDVPAPAGLRARVAGGQRGSRPASTRRWLPLAGGLAAAAAVAVLVVVLLPGSEPDAPTVAEAAALAERGALSPAPQPDEGEPNLLTASVAGVPFPDYREMFGWRAAGQRSDELEGREAGTVYYDREGREIAYTIVSGEALEWPPGSVRTTRDGVELRSLENDTGTVVTWLRDGRTCVLSGPGVARDELLELASWSGDGTVPF